MTEEKQGRRPRRSPHVPVHLQEELACHESTNYVQDLMAINDAVEKAQVQLKPQYSPSPEAGVWTGEVSFVSGEKAVIEWVLRLGKGHGYGNLIRHLREAWIDSLIQQGVSENTAVAAAWVSPRSRRDRGFPDVSV